MNVKRSHEGRSVWERVTSVSPEEQAAQDRARRRTGVLMGVLLGLAYGGVSQFINPIALPGIQLHQPPAGAAGNMLLSSLMGGVFGVLTCFPTSAAMGILLGGIAALAGIFSYMIVRLGGLGLDSALIGSVILSAPMAWLTLPVIALLRWATERQVSGQRNGEPLLVRARAPVALFLIMAFLASFELLPAEARDTLRRTDALIRQGLQATSATQLPAPLAGPNMTAFPAGRMAAYTLEWTQYDLDRFMKLRPPSNFDQHTAVIARFKDGTLLVCLYPTPRQDPNCANYDQMPAKAPERGDDA